MLKTNTKALFDFIKLVTSLPPDYPQQYELLPEEIQATLEGYVERILTYGENEEILDMLFTPEGDVDFVGESDTGKTSDSPTFVKKEKEDTDNG